MQPESRLQRRIRKALKRTWPDSYWWKTHGGPFTPAGIPDLLGCVQGRLCALEVKRPGHDASRVQLARMAQLKHAGAIVGIVTSASEAIDVVTEGLFDDD